MNHRWIARGLVVALHAVLLAALWMHRPDSPAPHEQRVVTTVRLILPTRPAPPAAPRVSPRQPPPRDGASPVIAPPPVTADDAPPVHTARTPPLDAAPTPAEPPRTTLRLTLPPGYAASANAAAARNPALRDPRSNTPRATLEDRIADATGGAGAWVEEQTSENRLQSTGALGEYRTVMRRGNTCIEIFRSRIADSEPFNSSVAPRAPVRMMGQPYPCK